MSWKTLCSQIDPICLKREFTVDEYNTVRQQSIRVNSTSLYKEYGGNMSYEDFYRILKANLYYDKLVCVHGVEFYYYVKFLTPRKEYKETDVLYEVRAIGDKHVQRYTK